MDHESRDWRRIWRLTYRIAIGVGTATVAGVLTYLGTRPISLSQSEGRAFFGVMLTYIPIALVAAFLQSRSEIADLAPKAALVVQRVTRLDSGVAETEVRAASMRARIDAVRPYVGESEADELSALIHDQDAIEADLAESRRTVTELVTELNPVVQSLRGDARDYIVSVVAASGGILFAPSASAMAIVLLCGVTLTGDLVFTLVAPMTDVLQRRETGFWLSLLVVGVSVAAGMAVGLCYRVTIA
jgi:hypothetical protein